MEVLQRKLYIPVFVLALLLGLLFNLQSDVFSTAREDIATIQYQQLQADNEELSQQIKLYKDRLDELQSAGKESEKNLSMIEHYKLLSGFTDVVGEGITIQLSLSDLDQSLNLLDFHRNLLFLINELNAAGAEAISIKEERIISNSEISLGGNHIVVNGQKLSPPFTVSAIGNPDTLDAALNLRQGYVERLRNNGYFVEVKKHDIVEIPKYPIVPTYIYAEPFNEE